MAEGLDAELENLRAALTWFMDRGDHASVQRFAGSLGVYLMDRGLLTEMRSWLEKSLESESDSPGLVHAAALSRLSQVDYLQGDYESARTAAQRSLIEARSIGDLAAIELSMMSLANALEAQGSLDEALDLQEKALKSLDGSAPRALGDCWWCLSVWGTRHCTGGGTRKRSSTARRLSRWQWNSANRARARQHAATSPCR